MDLVSAAPGWIFEVVLNRYILLLPSLAVFLLGAAAYMCAGLGSSPYDALPFIISGHVRRFPFKIVRMLWDISFMAAGLVLGGDVGIVTILVAFFLNLYHHRRSEEAGGIDCIDDRT